MDPISIGLMLAGLGSSLFGGLSNAKAANQDIINKVQAETQRRAQQLDEARARNAVLNTYMGRQDQYRGDNTSGLDTTVQSFAMPAQETKRAAEEAKLSSAIGSAIGSDSDYRLPTLSASSAPEVAAAFEKALGGTLNRSRASGDRLAKMASHGATWADNADVVGRNSGRINTTNAIARNDLANLPTAQDFAGFQTERVINNSAPTDRSLGTILTGLGSALGAAGASGQFGNLGGLWNTGSVTPGFGTGFSTWLSPAQITGAKTPAIY